MATPTKPAPAKRRKAAARPAKAKRRPLEVEVGSVEVLRPTRQRLTAEDRADIAEADRRIAASGGKTESMATFAKRLGLKW